MKIKKVDDKPMVIHTKEKTKLHVKQEPEAKIKGRNILVVEKGPKVAGTDKESKAEKADSRKSARKGRAERKEEIRKTVQKESSVYAQVQKSKQGREKAIGKKNSTVGSVVSVGVMTALDQTDGANEVYESYRGKNTFGSGKECGKCWRTAISFTSSQRAGKAD